MPGILRANRGEAGRCGVRVPASGRGIFDDQVAKKADIVRQLDKADRATGSILDAGFGTVENAFDFAWRGCKFMGIDFLEGPISSGGTGNAEF